MKIRLPDGIKIFTAVDSGIDLPAGTFTYGDVELTVAEKADRLSVSVRAEQTPLLHMRFRWNFTDDEERLGVRVMGDSWARSYADLEWRGDVPHRFMPWYMLVSNGSDLESDCSGRLTECFGVATSSAAFCSWQRDPRGVTLWMDVRSGGNGVILGGRTLKVCEIIMKDYRNVSAYTAGRAFCSEMCPSPLPLSHKVYGSNNWYYAVGQSSHGQILRDARLVSRLAEGITPRPYMVIDDGWQKNPCDGPWNSGNERFPDMARLAAEIEECGAVPGIWIRFLYNSTLDGVTEDMCIEGRLGYLDPSVPEVIEHVRECIRRLRSWGYRLIKHDFSLFDSLGVYGHARGGYLAPNGWSFKDKSRTSAEIITGLYRAILEEAGEDTVIIACNTPSHLTAGLAHVMRTGFDTSGRYFERTRLCGVNTLAFRMMQNGTFYAVDADCCSHTGKIDWALNAEWLRLLSESGTPLFISTDPDKTTPVQEADIRRAFRLNACGEFDMRPLDWMDNQTPELFSVNGEVKRYRWYTEEGTHQFIPPTDPEY